MREVFARIQRNLDNFRCDTALTKQLADDMPLITLAGSEVDKLQLIAITKPHGSGTRETYKSAFMAGMLQMLVSIQTNLHCVATIAL